MNGVRLCGSMRASVAAAASISQQEPRFRDHAMEPGVSGLQRERLRRGRDQPGGILFLAAELDEGHETPPVIGFERAQLFQDRDRFLALPRRARIHASRPRSQTGAGFPRAGGRHAPAASSNRPRLASKVARIS
jgi:hypothetical protein